MFEYPKCQETFGSILEKIILRDGIEKEQDRGQRRKKKGIRKE